MSIYIESPNKVKSKKMNDTDVDWNVKAEGLKLRANKQLVNIISHSNSLFSWQLSIFGKAF